MHHAERANDFDAAEWQAWAGLLVANPSVHLSAPAVRAALESPSGKCVPQCGKMPKAR